MGNGEHAKLELLMIIGEENAERYAFYFKIKVAGIFSWYEERMSIEEDQKEIESKGIPCISSDETDSSDLSGRRETE